MLTLALGIAANTTVFGWIDGLLVHPYRGVSGSEHLVAIETISARGEYSNTSYRDYRDYRDNLTSVAGLTSSLMNAFSVGPVTHPRRVFGEYVAGNYFAVLGVRTILGRSFLPAEYADKPGAFPVAVISYRLWKSMGEARQDVVGKTLRVNRYELTIVGVAPEEFQGTMPGMTVEIWIPITMAPLLNGQNNWLLEDRTARQMWVTGRLKPGVPWRQASTEVEVLSRRLAAQLPGTESGFRGALMPVWKAHFGVQTVMLAPLQILIAICLVLFLIVGANIANLQLARAIARRRELTVRLALGASRWRIARQLLTESLLLTTLGGLLGICVAALLAHTLLWLRPPFGFPLKFEFQLNADVLAFTVLLCCAGSLLTGVAPAWHTLRGNLVEALNEGGRSATSGAGQNRLRAMLVVSETALALVALIGTVLFVQSFRNARNTYPGFDTRGVLFAKYHLDTFCTDAEQRARFCLRLRDRLSTLPGIENVSFANGVPLELGMGMSSNIQVPGYAAAANEELRVQSDVVSTRYFATLRIPVLAGRDFSEQDDHSRARVGIVNQTFTRRYFGGSDPIGRRIEIDGVRTTVTGLVRDSKTRGLTGAAAAQIYLPYRQHYGDEFWTAFFIRTRGPAKVFSAAVHREAAAIDPNAGATDVIEFEEAVSGSWYAQKVAALLLSVLGSVSLALSAIGVYSVLAYGVKQREHEIGIRLALGAAPSAVIGMVLRRGLMLTAIGIMAGTMLGVYVMHMGQTLLIGVSATDPTTIAGSAFFLVLVAAVASYLPARRATKIDAAAVLREV